MPREGPKKWQKKKKRKEKKHTHVHINAETKAKANVNISERRKVVVPDLIEKKIQFLYFLRL